MKNTCVLASFALAAILVSAPSQAAFNIGILGGVSFKSGSSLMNNSTPLVGGEITYGLGDTLQLGGFYDHNFISQGSALIAAGNPTTGSASFYGVVARLGIPMTQFFVDGKVGVNNQSAFGTDGGSKFGFGVGAGYRIGLGPVASISPRLGYRFLPTTTGGIPTPGGDTTLSGGTFDLTALLQFGF